MRTTGSPAKEIAGNCTSFVTPGRTKLTARVARTSSNTNTWDTAVAKTRPKQAWAWCPKLPWLSSELSPRNQRAGSNLPSLAGTHTHTPAETHNENYGVPTEWAAVSRGRREMVGTA